MPNNNILNAALTYRAAGLSVIPVDQGKKPLCAWKPFQEQPANKTLIQEWFRNQAHPNLGIVCGQVSGGLLVLDFDQEALVTYRHWRKAVGHLAEKLPAVRTGKGVHVYMRTVAPGGNRRLAMNAAGRVLIETRGEGGYVIAPPSRHSSGRPYRWVQGSHLIPRISAGARDSVLEAAIALDERGASKNGPVEPGDRSCNEMGNGEQRLRHYALAVLARETARLAVTPAGNRNQRLNQAAFKVGRYANASLLSHILIEDMLAAACASGGNNLIPDDGLAAFQATFRSGLQAGMTRAINPEILLKRLNENEDPK